MKGRWSDDMLQSQSLMDLSIRATDITAMAWAMRKVFDHEFSPSDPDAAEKVGETMRVLAGLICLMAEQMGEDASRIDAAASRPDAPPCGAAPVRRQPEAGAMGVADRRVVDEEEVRAFVEAAPDTTDAKSLAGEVVSRFGPDRAVTVDEILNWRACRARARLVTILTNREGGKV